VAPIQVAGMDELLFVTVLVCIATVAVWEAAKWAFQCVKKACKESPKQRKLRRLREAARAAAEEEVDRAVSHRSMETEEPSTPPTTRRPITPPRSSSSVQRNMEPMYPTGCAFEACPLDAFYKTDSNRSKLHTDPHCHGLRNAGTVYKVEYCAYCSKSEPLFVKRSRSVPRMNF